jgi:hypothetical protein
MASAMFTETLDNLQHSMRLIPKSPKGKVVDYFLHLQTERAKGFD